MEEYAAIAEIEIRTEAAVVEDQRSNINIRRRNLFHRTASAQGQLGPSRSWNIHSHAKENIYGKTKVLKEALDRNDNEL